ncbi:hypothetical protein [Streptomyces sp. NPDC001068]|uniref:hypothetical protein n=1 Tax=Streptomyces sp. NPDC001068 TaxID=3364544 RepID=UPI0036A9EF16
MTTETGTRRPHAQEAEILKLIGEGLNDTAIAERLYCGKQAVRKVRRAHGLPPAARITWRKAHPKEAEIFRLLKKGLSNTEIRQLTGADMRTIARRRAAGNILPAPLVGSKGRTHPRQAEILAALQAGDSNSAIAQKLGVDKSAVGRVRRTHKLPGYLERRRGLQPSLAELWIRHARTVDGGHVEWNGPRSNGSRTPILRHLGSWYSAAAVAFEMRTGRPAVGQVRAECKVKHCVAPACVEDEPGRQGLRLQLRRLRGLQDPPTGTCDNGHDLTTEGRLDAQLHPYCEGCKREGSTRARNRTTS